MLHVASGIYPLTFSSPSPVTNKYCFLLFSLLLVKAAFRSLQTLGAVPVAGFLHASSFYETKENAKQTVSLCGWNPPHFFPNPLQTPLQPLYLSGVSSGGAVGLARGGRSSKVPKLGLARAVSEH